MKCSILPNTFFFRWTWTTLRAPGWSAVCPLFLRWRIHDRSDTPQYRIAPFPTHTHTHIWSWLHRPMHVSWAAWRPSSIMQVMLQHLKYQYAYYHHVAVSVSTIHAVRPPLLRFNPWRLPGILLTFEKVDLCSPQVTRPESGSKGLVCLSKS